jgi:hypothetical protein
MTRIPPRRKPGWGKGPRTFSGEVMDIRATSQHLGQTECQTRSQIARGILPYRRLGGRIIVLRSELCNFLDGLEGVSIDQAQRTLAAMRGE